MNTHRLDPWSSFRMIPVPDFDALNLMDILKDIDESAYLYDRYFSPIEPTILELVICPTYFITAPSFIFPGINTSLAVHWFGEEHTEVNVTGEILRNGKSLVTTSNVFHKDSIGILTLPALPKQTSSDYFELFVNGTAINELLFSDRSQVRMQINNKCVFIQTDKAVYTPGQTVKIRVISVDHDLRPYQGHVNLLIMDPQNNIINQWLKLKSDLGVVSADFPLSSNPMFGTWCIKTITNVSSMSSSFQNALIIILFQMHEINEEEVVAFFSVNEHVLPRFDVAINVSSFYIETKKSDVAGSVTAKYTYGKPVVGMLTVSVTPMYNYGYSEAINKTYQISGSVNFTFTHEEIKDIFNWGSINLTAYVTEDLSGIVMKTMSNVHKRYSEYTVLINNGRPPFISPDYIGKIKIQVLRMDYATLSVEEREKNISVKITQSPRREWWFHEKFAFPDNNSFTASANNGDTVVSKEYTIPEAGIITIEFPVQTSTQMITVEAQYLNSTGSQYFDISYKMNPFIDIHIPNSQIEVGRKFDVQVNTYPNVQEIYYVVMAKGMIVVSGVKMNTSFSLTPEHSWAPSADLVVYFLNINDSDIVKNTQNLHIKGVFKNRVSLSWSKSKAQPSETVSLTINVGEQRSLVGLQIIDKSARFMSNENDLTASRVEDAFITYTQNEYSMLTDANLISQYLPSDVFGTEFISLDTTNYKPVVARTLFPETWIWLEMNISSTTTRNLQVTVPNTITSWDASAFVISEDLGLAVTKEPVELEVFQSFFISLNLPYSVTRGEQFILEVIVFNYLEENLKVTLILEASDSFEIIVPKPDVSNAANQKDVVVPSQDGKTVLFPIKPQKLGEIPITVKATSSVASDVKTQNIIVKAEGVKHYYSKTEVFHVDGTGDVTQNVSKTFSFTFPSDTVQGSEEAVVTVIGDLLGPSIDGLESLIQMPCGCGEQNMINFAPNIYVLQYLTATNQLKADIRTKAISFMQQGYQRELSYKRLDGSFSAFGQSDSSGSTWLSAFVFRCFLQARPFIYISPAILDQTVQWLVQYQDLNTGIFSEPGRVIHTELQGGLNGPITLTAYILTSLLEDEAYRNLYASRVLKAVQYLESKFDAGISSNYTLSVVVYALSLANSTKANAALAQLNSRANNKGGLKYWSSPSETTNYWQPKSSDIETAAYALLSHCIQNRILDGIPITKWLSQQRNHLGGYSSTQDTIMALQALAQFMVVAPSEGKSLNIKVTGPSLFVPKTFAINSENLLVLQSQQIPVSQPLSFDVSAVGNGLAIIQLNVMYNQKASSRRKRNALIPEAFTLDVTVNEDEHNIDKLSVEVCTSYQGAGNESGMALLDVGFLSGFTLAPVGIPINGSLKLVEKKDDKVYLYYDSMTKTQMCVSVPMVRAASVAGSQDSVIRVCDYYNQRKTATRTYNSDIMRKISSCDFCGLDCSLCKSSVSEKPPPSDATTRTFNLFGICMGFFLFTLLETRDTFIMHQIYGNNSMQHSPIVNHKPDALVNCASMFLLSGLVADSPTPAHICSAACHAQRSEHQQCSHYFSPQPQEERKYPGCMFAWADCVH
ncbi:CD109 antigen-like [Pelodytes ibericus]